MTCQEAGARGYPQTHYRDRGDGICRFCGRVIGWHAGNRCYAPDATGMPAPELAPYVPEPELVLELEEPRTISAAIELEEPRLWSNTIAADYSPDQAGFYDNPPPAELELEPVELLELAGGQLAISADVEERGQLVITELARPPIPAPLNHEPEHPADDLYRLTLEG